MRAHLLLFPAALIATFASCDAAHAKVFMNIKQAQSLIFPGASFTPHLVGVAEAPTRQTAISPQERKTAISPQERKTEVWRVSTGGWFFIDRVFGKDDIITYAVGVTATGKVRQIEILECLSDYDTVTMPEWRAQFQGKVASDSFADVQTISGTTLSSRHITEGVKRLLGSYALLIRSGDE